MIFWVDEQALNMKMEQAHKYDKNTTGTPSLGYLFSNHSCCAYGRRVTEL